MMRFIRDLRLIPIALIASACLLALKTADLVLNSPYVFSGNDNSADNGDVSVVRSASGAIASVGIAEFLGEADVQLPRRQGRGAAAEPAADRVAAIQPRE